MKKYEGRLADDPMSRVFVPLADIYRKLGRYKEAIAVAKEGVARHPGYTGAKMALARAYAESGDTAAAVEWLEEIRAEAPDNLLAHRLLSKIYVEERRPEAAIPVLKRLLLLDPRDAEAAARLTELEDKEAGPRPAIVTPTLAHLYQSQGHLGKALEIYRKLSENEPENPVYARAASEIETEIVKREDPRRPLLEELLSRVGSRRRPAAGAV